MVEVLLIRGECESQQVLSCSELFTLASKAVRCSCGIAAVRPLDGGRHVGAVCRQLVTAGTVNSLRTEDDGRPAWRISSSEFGQAGPIPSFSSSTHSQDGPLFSFPGPRPPR